MISHEIDRIGVSRIVMGLDFFGAAPIRDTPQPPVPIPLVRAVANYENGGANGTVQFYFEGATPEDVGRGLELAEFDGSFDQEPITSHPAIARLLRDFNGTVRDGTVEWPQFLGRSTGIGLTRGTVAQPPNPMFGIESYLAIGAVYRRTRIYDSLPADLWNGVGLIYAQPPGAPPTPANRNWLKMPPIGRLRGNVTEVTHAWILSGVGGWVEPVYDGSDVGGE